MVIIGFMVALPVLPRLQHVDVELPFNPASVARHGSEVVAASASIRGESAIYLKRGGTRGRLKRVRTPWDTGTQVLAGAHTIALYSATDYQGVAVLSREGKLLRWIDSDFTRSRGPGGNTATFAGVSVEGDSFFVRRPGEVQAFASSGKRLWHITIPGDSDRIWLQPPAVDGGLLFTMSDRDDGPSWTVRVHAYNSLDGREVMEKSNGDVIVNGREELPPALPSITAANGLCFACRVTYPPATSIERDPKPKVELVCRNPRTGIEVWASPITYPYALDNLRTIATSGATVFVADQLDWVAAFNANTGRQLWTHTDAGRLACTHSNVYSFEQDSTKWTLTRRRASDYSALGSATWHAARAEVFGTSDGPIVATAKAGSNRCHLSIFDE